MAGVKVSRIIGLLALVTISLFIVSFSILVGIAYANIKIDNLSSFKFDTNNPDSYLEKFAYSLFDISSVLSAIVVVLVSIYFCCMLDQ